MEWPGHSPDLNPIENLWNDMKRKLGKLPISNVDCLVKKKRMLWAEVDDDYCKKVADNMPKRIKAVKS